MSRAVPVPEDFDVAPSAAGVPPVTVGTDVPTDGMPIVGVVLAEGQAPPERLGLSPDALELNGFTTTRGTTLLVPAGTGNPHVLVGAGDAAALDGAGWRDLGAAFALAARGRSNLAVLAPAGADVQALVEGVLLARYQYTALRSSPKNPPLRSLHVVVASEDVESATAAAGRGRALATATSIARDLANGPPAHVTAERLGAAAERLGRAAGLTVEVFDREALLRERCGGVIAVNGGSAHEPRMVRLTYAPAGEPTGHLAMVAKGIMYDSGGIALKPADDTHANMKNDMSGAAAVLASMLTLRELGCTTHVTGYLMCTDNMPGGTALAMGDVITARNGMTVEVSNTDAEGRLAMMDALVMAAEQQPDAILDIATLTGAAMRAFGTLVAAVMGNDQAVVDQVLAAAAATDERAWSMPLERAYRSQLDSDVADIKNLGGPNAGAITAGLFLAEFVAGRPWAHVDIAGTAQADPPGSWRPEGCTGFGARLLAELALDFTPPR